MANVKIDTINSGDIYKLIKKLIPMAGTENSGLSCISLHVYI